MLDPPPLLQAASLAKGTPNPNPIERSGNRARGLYSRLQRHTRSLPPPPTHTHRRLVLHHSHSSPPSSPPASTCDLQCDGAHVQHQSASACFASHNPTGQINARLRRDRSLASLGSHPAPRNLSLGSHDPTPHACLATLTSTRLQPDSEWPPNNPGTWNLKTLLSPKSVSPNPLLQRAGIEPHGHGTFWTGRYASNVCSSHRVVTGQPAALYIAYLLLFQAKVLTIRSMFASLHSQAACNLSRSGAQLS